MTAGHATRQTASEPAITIEQLQLATRNHGMPLEVLRHDVTPPGLHYLLIHYDIPAIEPSAWSLEVGGLVRDPLRLDLAALQRRRTVTRRVTMECAGNGRTRMDPGIISQPWLHEAVGTSDWTGTPVADLLDEAGAGDGAVEAVFTGADRGVEGGIDQHYARSVTLEELRDTGAVLAWAQGGAPLLPQHGAPVRLVVPGWYGMTNVKWLTRVEVTDRPFEGYQQVASYRLRQGRDEPGEPLSRLSVRSLMVPPGVPEFRSRHRVVERGTHELMGRAWSGRAAIRSVEVSADGGRTWWAAHLQQPADPAAWTGWRTTWQATEPGEFELLSRATDEAGNSQPDEPAWNLGGYANNAVQRVGVTVR